MKGIFESCVTIGRRNRPFWMRASRNSSSIRISSTPRMMKGKKNRKLIASGIAGMLAATTITAVSRGTRLQRGAT